MKHSKTALANNLGVKSRYGTRFYRKLLLVMELPADEVPCQKAAPLGSYSWNTQKRPLQITWVLGIDTRPNFTATYSSWCPISLTWSGAKRLRGCGVICKRPKTPNECFWVLYNGPFWITWVLGIAMQPNSTAKYFSSWGMRAMWARAKRWSGWIVIRRWKSVHHTFWSFRSNFKRPFLNNFSVRKSHATPLQGKHLLTMGHGRVAVLCKQGASLGSYLLLNSWSPYILVFLKITFTLL